MANHPIFIHFPIAFIFLYIFTEVINLFVKNENLRKLSIIILTLGVIGGIFSVISGNLSYQNLLTNNSITPYHLVFIDKHELFASLTLWYFFFLLICKVYFLLKRKNHQLIQFLFTIFAISGGYLLYKAAKFGGRLVYEFGIGTNLLN